MPMVGMAIAGAFGGGAEAGMRLGGVLGIVGVAVNLLINHWDKLIGMMGFGVIRTEAEQMEELGKKAHKTGEEIAKLAQYERERAEAQKLAASVPSARREAGDRVEKAIVESDAGKVRGALMAGLMPPITPQQQHEIDKAWSFLPENAAKAKEAAVKKVQEQRDAEAGALADKIMARAALGDPNAVAQLKGEIAKNPAAFPGGLQERLKGADIGQVLTEQGMEAQAEMHDKSRQLGIELTQQGRDNEQAMYDERRQKRENEAARLAGAMDRSVGTKLLLDPKMGEDALKAQIHKSLQQSGLEKPGVASEDMDKLAQDIAVKMRQKMEHAVEGRAAERGISTEEARVELLKEERQKDIADRKRAGGTNEIFTSESYANRLLTATQSGQKDRTPEEQLQAQKDAVKRLDTIIEMEKAKTRGGDGVARFARGAARP